MDRLRWRENLESLASWTTNKLRSKKYMSWLTFLSPCCFISGVILVISAVGIYFILQAVLKHKVKEVSLLVSLGYEKVKVYLMGLVKIVPRQGHTYKGCLEALLFPTPPPPTPTPTPTHPHTPSTFAGQQQQY